MAIIFFLIAIAKLLGDAFCFHSKYKVLKKKNLLSAETLSADSQPKARFLESSFKSLDVSVFVMEMLT